MGDHHGRVTREGQIDVDAALANAMFGVSWIQEKITGCEIEGTSFRNGALTLMLSGGGRLTIRGGISYGERGKGEVRFEDDRDHDIDLDIEDAEYTEITEEPPALGEGSRE